MSLRATSCLLKARDGKGFNNPMKLEMLSNVLILIRRVDLFSEQILFPGILSLVDTWYRARQMCLILLSFLQVAADVFQSFYTNKAKEE